MNEPPEDQTRIRPSGEEPPDRDAHEDDPAQTRRMPGAPLPAPEAETTRVDRADSETSPEAVPTRSDLSAKGGADPETTQVEVEAPFSLAPDPVATVDSKPGLADRIGSALFSRGALLPGAALGLLLGAWLGWAFAAAEPPIAFERLATVPAAPVDHPFIEAIAGEEAAAALRRRLETPSAVDMAVEEIFDSTTPAALEALDLNGDGFAEIVILDATGRLSRIDGASGRITAVHLPAGPAPGSTVRWALEGGNLTLTYEHAGGAIRAVLSASGRAKRNAELLGQIWLAARRPESPPPTGPDP